jgi:nucleotide sugar dehydrogenase
VRLTVIGAGYVGLNTGVAAAYLGHDVVCVDKDPRKLALLNEGKSPIHEQGLEELLSQVRERIRFTANTPEAVRDADVIMIAVGTPPKSNGEADTSYVEEAVREVAQGLEDGRQYTLVVKSTVPIGTNRRVAHVVTRVLAQRGVTADIHFASNPEFLREGFALYDTFYPDRIVVGTESEAAVEVMEELYRPILEQSFEPPTCVPVPQARTTPPLVKTDPTSAEMIKYASNAFLAVKISFANEIAGLCERVGADVVEVMRGVGLDSRIGPRFLGAGLGWGGSCFPKDTAALISVAAEYGYDMPITEAARLVNARQRRVAVEKLQEALKVLRGRTIGVLGLAFKPGTDDVRESPAIDIIRMLVDRGVHVKAHDPVAMDNARAVLADIEVEFVHDPYELAKDADGLVLATEWDVYRELDLRKLAALMRVPVLVDGRNVFKPEEARAAGFTYLSIGRPDVYVEAAQRPVSR